MDSCGLGGRGTKVIRGHTAAICKHPDASARRSMNGTAVQDSKRVKLSSIFSHLEVVPLAEPFHMRDLFSADENPDKINLSVGGELLQLCIVNVYVGYAYTLIRKPVGN